MHSSVVHFRPRVLPADAPDFKAVEAITQAAFSQRRKMIRSSLKAYRDYIEPAGLDPTLRADDLRVEDYMRLLVLKAAHEAADEI